MNRTAEQTRHEFETPEPVDLTVEFGKGQVHIAAQDVSQTVIAIAGRHADGVDVSFDAGRISVRSPRFRDKLGRDAELDIRITVPATSQLACKTGSADIIVAGPIGDSLVASGSGDITVEALAGPSLLQTGSGSITVDWSGTDARIKSGSGDVTVGSCADGSLTMSTGSGDLHVGRCASPVRGKSGSGDLRVGQCDSDVDLSSSSGDIDIRSADQGQIKLKTASGDCRVAITAGTPVWTDISTRSGRVRSDLASTGEPLDGQPFVAVHVTSASGDVTLTEVPA